MSDTQYIPDNSGTIYVNGHEDEIFAFATKKTYSDTLAAEVGVAKKGLRQLALDALKRASEGAMRVCILGKAAIAVTASLPDYGKEGNRLVISDATYKAYKKAGGAEAMEVTEADIFDTTVVTGKKAVVLSGKWATWFAEQYFVSGKIDPEAEADIEQVETEPSTTRRLSHVAIARLKAISASGSNKARKVADLLLDKGLKAMTISVDTRD